jgi:hypothetical protein
MKFRKNNHQKKNCIFPSPFPLFKKFQLAKLTYVQKPPIATSRLILGFSQGPELLLLKKNEKIS